MVKPTGIKTDRWTRWTSRAVPGADVLAAASRAHFGYETGDTAYGSGLQAGYAECLLLDGGHSNDDRTLRGWGDFLIDVGRAVASDATRLTWDAADTFQGSTEWTLRLGGEVIAEIQRERPTRWHGNGVSGQVRDNDAPWLWLAWMFTPTGRKQIPVRDGSSVSTVKALVEKHVSDTTKSL